MKRAFLTLFLLAFAAYGQQRIAILNTEDDGDQQLELTELNYLTDRLRGIAGNVLKGHYGIMTQETIMDKLGKDAAKTCKESTCLADLGRKLNADYIAQGRVGRFGGNLTIKVEVYNSISGLQASPTITGDSKDVFGLLKVLDEKAPDMFKVMPGVPRGKLPSPMIPGGITGLESAVDYELDYEKRYLVNITTKPEGATPSFNGLPIPNCNKTPCKVELPNGKVRIIAALEQYEIADTTVSIERNNQNFVIGLKPNFGVLEINSAYLDGIGKYELWNLTINGEAYPLGEIRLLPGQYQVKISHRCYEDIGFNVGINKGRREVFDLANRVKLKKGGLVLSAEQDGEPVSTPVFVNGKRVGETPFSGSVPLCAEIEIDDSNVNVELKHNEKVEYKHSISNYETTEYIEPEPLYETTEYTEPKPLWKSNREVEKKTYVDRKKEEESGWHKQGFISLGTLMLMNNVDLYSPIGFLFSAGGIIFSSENSDLFRLGINVDFGGSAPDRNAIRKIYPDAEGIDGGVVLKLGVFANFPADVWYLSGGIDYGQYVVYDGTLNNGDRIYKSRQIPTFPIGTGFVIGGSSEGGIFIEALYHILPTSDTGYLSARLGFRFAMTE